MDARAVDVIGHLFFPSFQVQFVLTTILCALIVVYFAKLRFDQVATEVDWAEFSKRTRVWTSRYRYVGALCLYCWLNLLFFRGLLEFSEVLRILASNGALGFTKEQLAPFLAFPYATPPLAVLLMFVLLDNKLSPAAPAELAVRRYLQKLGSIPRYVRQILRRLERAKLQAVHASDDDGELGVLSGRQNLPAELATTWSEPARAAYVQSVVEQLSQEAPTDSFRAFLKAHTAAVDDIQKKLGETKNKIAHFLHLTKLLSHVTSPNSPDLMLQAWRDATAKELQRELKATMARQHLILSCAILAGVERQGVAILAEKGIILAEDQDITPREVILALRDDITLAVGLLVAGIYPSVLFLLWVGGWRPHEETGFTIGLLWPVMLVALMLGSILPVFFVLGLRTQRPYRPPALTTLPWLRSVLIGLCSAFIAATSLIFLDYLHPFHNSTLDQRIEKLAPFGLVAFGLACSLTLSLIVSRDRPAWMDAAIIALVTTMCGMAASLIAGTASDAMKLNLALALFAGTGAATGFIIPSAYRRRMRAAHLELGSTDFALLPSYR